MIEKRKKSHLSGLKILVSVVRFRPGPPKNKKCPALCGAFSFGLADESFRLNEAQLSCPVPPHTFLG